MPRRVVGILSLLLVFAFKMRAQGEVVLSIGGEPVNALNLNTIFVKAISILRILFYLLLSTIN